MLLCVSDRFPRARASLKGAAENLFITATANGFLFVSFVFFSSSCFFFFFFAFTRIRVHRASHDFSKRPRFVREGRGETIEIVPGGD